MKLNLTPRKIAAWLIGLAAFSALSIGVGYYAGGEAAKAHLARLSLVWPSPMLLPTEERALLLEVSLKCNLERVAMEKQAVISCLREGAAKLESGHPEIQAVKKLEDLLNVKQMPANGDRV